MMQGDEMTLGSDGQRSRSNDAEVRSGSPAEASFSRPFWSSGFSSL